MAAGAVGERSTPGGRPTGAQFNSACQARSKPCQLSHRLPADGSVTRPPFRHRGPLRQPQPDESGEDVARAESARGGPGLWSRSAIFVYGHFLARVRGGCGGCDRDEAGNTSVHVVGGVEVAKAGGRACVNFFGIACNRVFGGKRLENSVG